MKTSENEEVEIIHCSESAEKIREIYQAIKITEVPFKPRKSVQYQLNIQKNKTLITGYLTANDAQCGLKRDRRSQKRAKVSVMVESKTVKSPKAGKKSKKVRYLKMKVIEDLKSETITKNVKEHVKGTADLTTDDSTSYTKLKEHVHSHAVSIIHNEDLANALSWVHTAISNAKQELLDVYYKIKPEYLQYYTNQFCYKFNRRYFGEKQFDRLLIATVTYAPDFVLMEVIDYLVFKSCPLRSPIFTVFHWMDEIFCSRIDKSCYFEF